MPKLTYTVGLPGSGKTTWAREQMAADPNIRRVNRDDIRAMIQTKWTPKSERFTKRIRDFVIAESLLYGHNVICDDTNLTAKGVKELETLTKGMGMGLESKSFLDVPLHVCITRDEKRTNPVGASVIRDMWLRHVKPALPPQDTTLPSAVICDLDGTLAVLEGRDPYDASTCDKDGINNNVLDVLNDAKYEQGHTILFVSGREDKFRPQTEIFLRKAGHRSDLLFMRPTGDFRNDAVIKEEIYNREIKGKYHVDLVLDDRDRVVDMWRGLGLETWQVNYGNF